MGAPHDTGATDRQWDRRGLKRQLTLWRVLAIVACTALVTFVAMRYGGDAHRGGFGGGPYVARVTVEGVISSDQALYDHLDRLALQERVAAVVLSIDSPGGTFSGSEALYTAIRQLAEKKPTVAVMNGVAASGGYMAAIAADHIVARASTITGSIGVIMQMPQLAGLLDKLGVKMDAIRSGPLKATPSPFEETGQAERQAAQNIVLDLFDQFLEMVASRRALTDEALVNVRSGQVYTGRQAIELGLVDTIGGEAEARQWLAEAHGIDAELPILNAMPDEDADEWRRLLQRFDGGALFGPQPALDGPWAIWHLSL